MLPRQDLLLLEVAQHPPQQLRVDAQLLSQPRRLRVKDTPGVTIRTWAGGPPIAILKGVAAARLFVDALQSFGVNHVQRRRPLEQDFCCFASNATNVQLDRVREAD